MTLPSRDLNIKFKQSLNIISNNAETLHFVLVETLHATSLLSLAFN